MSEPKKISDSSLRSINVIGLKRLSIG
jgi:hypothetical protein